MTLRLWYAGRAIPWRSVSICLALAAAIIPLTSRRDSLASAALPLIALITAAAVAFVLDDPAAALTRVTPRGSRWSSTTRLTAAGLVTLAGVGILAAGPGDIGGLSGWPTVVPAMALAAIALAALRVRAHHATPGAAIASALVLLGLVPYAVQALFRAWPYPNPELSPELRDRWLVTAAVATLIVSWTLLRPLPRPRSRGRVGALASPAAPVPKEPERTAM